MRYAFLLAALVAAPAIAKTVDIGAEPDWDRAKTAVQRMIGDQLKDSESARWQWRGEGWSKTKKAWVICGRVNSKNSYGAYEGWQQFKLNVVQGVGQDWKIAPIGLGFNECNSELGYHEA